MAADPDMYMGLAQLASEYDERNTMTENIMAQVASEDDSEMSDIAELLAQMDVQELEELHEMLAQTDVEVEADDEAYENQF